MAFGVLDVFQRHVFYKLRFTYLLYLLAYFWFILFIDSLTTRILNFSNHLNTCLLYTSDAADE